MKTFLSSKPKLDQKAILIIESTINKIIESNNQGNFSICGGRSVENIFKLLTKATINWKNVNIYWVDERNVPKTNQESNYLLAKNLFLDYIDIPKKNIHYFNINEYNKIRKLDLILLSSGEDGHVAALFPNHHSIKSNLKSLEMDDSPKLPKQRFTMGKKLLLTADTSILLFYGKSKQDAYVKFKSNKSTITDCPAKLVENIKNSYILTDF